ncbi:copper chaperone PCu(A)C [Sphingomonas oryzagri]|uniref:Copper chaperone PCu(A)C n=1 Tax=Sphingomonas oryzagri TaxID=3042314 RepID=A0ABT6MW44_9SPHN|nr:copper chaperone PCu(A)C [Sphingomonas oryzagri]MDH7637175.1 copper chaperone PCu(A)C [Sphingomonas oryzagri]
MRIARIAPWALLALAGCHHEAKLSADQAWVRLPAVAGNPGAGYLTIHGGPQPTRLLAVESPAAGSTELHESMKMGPGGMTGMQRLDGLDVPANGTVRFAPGGNHVMMFGLGAALKAGDTIPLSIRFEKGQPLTVEAKVVGAGDAAPY